MKKYIVREGDTMWSISKATGVRLNLLMAANPQVTDPNRLKPGNVIVIPELYKKTATPTKPSSKPSNPQMEPAQAGEVPPYFGFVWPHVVKAGDTWESIAAMHNASVAQLQELNPSQPEGRLPEGQVIYVPGVTSQGLAGPGAPTAPGGMYPEPEMGPQPEVYPGPGVIPDEGMVPQPGFEPFGPHTHYPYRIRSAPGFMPGVSPVKPAHSGYWAFIPYHPHFYGLPPVPAMKVPSPHMQLPATWYSEWDDSSSSWRGGESSSWNVAREWDDAGAPQENLFTGTLEEDAYDESREARRDSD
jgi:LysM repeat protein